MEDVESTQRMPCAPRWETDVFLDEAALLDSVTKVRAAPNLARDARASTRPPRPKPSWKPERRSEAPATTDSPTLRQEIPRELLRMLRPTPQRRDEERPIDCRLTQHGLRATWAVEARTTDLHDTDECPTADLSDVDDIEWLDD